MVIDPKILRAYGAVDKNYKKGEIIFSEGTTPRFYFELISGCIKMVNHNEEGKLFIQGIFTDGMSFGEPPLFVDEMYPATAYAVTDVEVLRISKDHFLKMMDQKPELYKNFTLLLAERVFEKARSNKMLSDQQPENRIINFLNSIKKKSDQDKSKRILICLTRQDIADFTGMRVETAIRTLKKMELENKIEIKNRKLYY